MAAIDRFNWNDLALTYMDEREVVPRYYVNTNDIQVANNHDTLAHVIDQIYREQPAVNINWPHKVSGTGDQEIAILMDLQRRGLISQKKILSAFNFDNLEVVKEFVAQSAREAETSIAAAERDGDKERHTWWCGFAEALNEILAKMAEMEETIEETDEHAEEVDDWINQEDTYEP